MIHRLRWRFWAAAAIALVAAGLATLAFLSPTWIEVVFGVDPDEGSGALEWALVGGAVVALVVAVVSIFVAGVEWRRAWVAEGRKVGVGPGR
jgi:hypothetical protein